MALDLTGLTAYVEEHTDGILSTAILSPKFTNYVTTWENVKSSIKLPNLESTVPFQAGGTTCNTVTSSGTTTVTQTELATSAIEFAEKICLHELEPYFTQKYLPKGAKPDTAKIMQDILNRKMAKVALQLEQMILQGKTTYTNSTILKQINGLIAKVDTAGTAVAATASTFNETNAATILDEIIFEKIPTAIMNDDPIVFMGPENYRTLVKKLKNTNAYNFFPNASDLTKGEFIYPGSTVKIVALAGLSNATAVDTGALPTAVKNRVLVWTKQNVNYGVDLSSDSTSTDVWYEKKERAIYIYGRFRAGIVGRFYEQMVQYTNS